VHCGLFGGCRASVDTDFTSRQLSVHIFAKPLVRHDKSTCSCASNLHVAAKIPPQLPMAFLVLLEALSPVERAVFMLREVFGYGYPDVARITGKTEVNCRQIFARARDDANPHPLVQHLLTTVSSRPSSVTMCSTAAAACARSVRRVSIAEILSYVALRLDCVGPQ
jgi:hypothetical protein